MGNNKIVISDVIFEGILNDMGTREVRLGGGTVEEVMEEYRALKERAQEYSIETCLEG